MIIVAKIISSQNIIIATKMNIMIITLLLIIKSLKQTECQDNMQHQTIHNNLQKELVKALYFFRLKFSHK